MPLVQVGDNFINPLLVINVESITFNRTIEEDDGKADGLKKQEMVEAVNINCIGDNTIRVEGTGDTEAVANHISKAMDICLKLCSLGEDAYKYDQGNS